MNIGALDPLDPTMALAAAQAARQLLAPNYPSAQASEALEDAQAADIVSLSNPASGGTNLSNLITDPFASLMQQATSVAEAAANPQAASDQSATASTIVQAANQTQLLDTNSATSSSVLNPPLELPDSQITLLQQAYLAPLASQVSTGPAQNTNAVAEQAQRDVAATAALSPAGAFGNGQTSTPNPYTLVPGAAQAMATPGSPGNGGAENYMLMQQLLAPTIATGSLDLLV